MSEPFRPSGLTLKQSAIGYKHPAPPELRQNQLAIQLASTFSSFSV
jgi:hypothetical protein